MTGFRISEVLSLTVGSVVRGGEMVGKIGIAPRHLKGGYGRTRWIPVLPELAKALERHLGWLRRRFEVVPAMPLFFSRESAPGGEMRALSRESARRIICGAFAQAKLLDDGRLGTHTLRKTWARKVYENSGNDLMVLKAALGHSGISVTQKYLEVSEDAVAAAIAECDLAKIGPRPGKIVEIARITGTRLAVAG
jgi:integrase